MTRKLSDLRELIERIKDNGYRYEVPITVLKRAIAEQFGTSQYVFSSVMDELRKFELIFASDGPNIYRLTKLKPKTKKLTRAELEEMDKLLE